MKINELLTSPPPATGWSLDPGMAAVVRRQAKSELRCAAVETPEGTFEVGPVGLQSVDEDRLRPVLTRLQEEVEGSKRAAVIVPTGWLRTHLLEFDDLPRRQADLRDMVMWRLKKLIMQKWLRWGSSWRITITQTLPRALSGCQKNLKALRQWRKPTTT